MLAQQLSIKLYAQPAAGAVDLAGFIPIFHRWIRDHHHRLCGKLLIDVADYRHVPEGPGVILVGHEAHWGIDEGAGGLGLLYTRKRDPAGPLGDKLHEAVADTLAVARLLAAEAGPPITLAVDRMRIAILSRRYASNDAATLTEARPELDRFLAKLYGRSVELVHLAADPRAPFALEVRGAGAADAAALLARLA